MIRGPIALVAIGLMACGQGSQIEDNSIVRMHETQPASNACEAPALAFADGNQSLKSDLLEEATSNFVTAYQGACAENLLHDKPLIDPAASDQERLFLVNAPEANVATIYLSEIDGNRMVLEYPFLTIDGKSQVPSADELEEAIYCAVVGATPEEQERTGRCLPD